jgi:phospholipid/cholesterol/gamma-HCH transport system permease protein
MGPLLTTVLLAGRTASSFAAEIGTMKINQEIDALKTMGLIPIRFLVVPRILATMLITPMLEVFFIIFGLLGSLIVMLTLGYTTNAFVHQLQQAIAPIDYIGGLIKVFVFGLVIASVGCLHGIKTRFGAQAVGHSTTQAVVSSLIMLVVVDGIFALIYYVLDI